MTLKANGDLLAPFGMDKPTQEGGWNVLSRYEALDPRLQASLCTSKHLSFSSVIGVMWASEAQAPGGKVTSQPAAN